MSPPAQSNDTDSIPLSIGFRTDTGLVRIENQDAVSVTSANERTLLVVCDGMGGHAGGRAASSLVIRRFVAVITASAEFDAGSILSAVKQSDQDVRVDALENPERTGMGTTLAALWIQRNSALIAHVGDSRVYLLRGGTLMRLTDDHSLVFDLIRRGEITEEEARTHPRRNVITRAIDGRGQADVDVQSVELQSGDRLLLCTDGLNGMVRDADIQSILRLPDTPDALCQRLVSAALNAGGHDNVSLIVALVGAATGPETSAKGANETADGSRAPRPGTGGWTYLLLVAIAMVLAVLWLVLVQPRTATEVRRPSEIDTAHQGRSAPVDSVRQRATPSWEQADSALIR